MDFQKKKRVGMGVGGGSNVPHVNPILESILNPIKKRKNIPRPMGAPTPSPIGIGVGHIFPKNYKNERKIPRGVGRGVGLLGF